MGNPLRLALEYYVETDDIEGVLAVARTLTQLRSRSAGLDDILIRSLELVPPDSHQAGQLLPGYLRVLVRSREFERGLEVLAQALAIARREQDAALEMEPLESATHAFFFQLNIQKTLECSGPARELARQLNEIGSEEHISWVTARALLVTGDLAGARPLTTASLSLAEQLRDRPRLAHAFWLNAEVSILQGDWVTGRGLNDRALALAPQDPIPLSWRAILEYETGHFSQGEACLERLVETMSFAMPSPFHFGGSAVVIPMAARITGSVDRFDVATAAAEAVLSSPNSYTSYHYVIASAGLALVAVQRGDMAAAKKQYSTLESQRGRLVSWMPLSIDHLLGLLAQTMKDLDQAASHFEDALSFCRKAGYRPELAWTCHDYADALLHPPTSSGRADPGNREKAMSLLDESLNISSELGMGPLRDRVLALQEQAQSRPARAPAYPDGLTQREVEVLRLVAAGKTDREIAEVLIIGVRTVTTHVSNILNKANAVNRTEAASYANQQGLV